MGKKPAVYAVRSLVTRKWHKVDSMKAMLAKIKQLKEEDAAFSRENYDPLSRIGSSLRRHLTELEDEPTPSASVEGDPPAGPKGRM